MFEQQAFFSAVEYDESKPKPVEIYRADGSCICASCGQEYRKHPRDEQELSAIDFDREGNELPFLHVLCNGDRAKL